LTSRTAASALPRSRDRNPAASPPPGFGHPVFALAALVGAIRRRWRLAAVTALIGSAAALGIAVVSPPAFSATVVLQLAHPSQDNPGRAMLTDAALAKTRIVAQGAVNTLRERLSSRRMVDTYQTEILSDDLLRITATGPSERSAVRRADSVAASFLAFRRDLVQRQLGLNVDTLEKRKQPLRSELADVNTTINNPPPTSPSPGSSAYVQALGDLLVRRSSLNDQIAAIDQRIRDATNESGLIIDNSRIIDPSTADDRHVVKTLVGNVAAGLVAGLALGTGWIVLQYVISDRIRQRADAAEALAAPVPLSVGEIRPARKGTRRRARRRLARPEPALALVVRHLRENLPPEALGRKALVVIPLGTDRIAALAVASLAVTLASEGHSVLLGDLSASLALSRFCNARKTKLSRVVLAGESVAVATVPPSEAARPEPDVAEELRTADVVLVLATVDLAVGARYLRDWADSAVAIVAAGRSPTTAVHSVGVLVRNAGLDLLSGVLVGGDRRDISVGTADVLGSVPLDAPATARAAR